MVDLTALYSYQGQEPQPLPHEIRLSDGTSRTDASSFTDEEILDAGYTGPYSVPEIDDKESKIVWNKDTQSYEIINDPVVNHALLYSYKRAQPDRHDEKLAGKRKSEIEEMGYYGPYTQPIANFELEKLNWNPDKMEIEIIPKTSEERWREVRMERNFYLRESDWSVMPDNQLSPEERQIWEDYRQELRNVPQLFSEPNDVVWPTPPATIL